MQRNTLKPTVKPLMHSSSNVSNESSRTRSHGTRRRKDKNTNRQKKKKKTGGKSKMSKAAILQSRSENEKESDKNYGERKTKKKKPKDIDVEIAKEYFKMIASKKTIHKKKEGKQAIIIEQMPANVTELTMKSTSRMKRLQKDAIRNFENDGKLFDDTGRPFWTLFEFNSEDIEKEGIEVEGRLSSDHVVKYLEGAITFAAPPATKPPFDVTSPIEVLQGRDDVYFSVDAVHYNTLQNIIDHSAKALQRCTGDEVDARQPSIDISKSPEKKTQEDDTNRNNVKFKLEDIPVFIYDRSQIVKCVALFFEKRRSREKDMVDGAQPKEPNKVCQKDSQKDVINNNNMNGSVNGNTNGSTGNPKL